MKKSLEPLISIILFALVLFFVFVAITRGQSSAVATGGQFSVEKQVVAGGGNAMTRLAFTHEGTAGQTIAGTKSTGGNYSLYSGFWTPDDLSPTAATAVVGGRVTTADGRGIRNARLTLTLPEGTARTAISGPFGNFQFEDVPVGTNCVVSVFSRRFGFARASILVEVIDDVRGLEFIADDE